MKISDLLQKKEWKREIIDDRGGFDYSIHPKGIPTKQHVTKVVMTQEDFAREINPFTHNINSAIVRSNRKVFKAVIDPKTKKPKRVFSHFAPVSRISLGLQDFIIHNKVAHFAGDGIWFNNESLGYDEAFNQLKTHYDISGFHYAWRSCINSLFYTCDAAMYLYKEDGEVKWEVFSKLKGDTLYSTINEEGEQVFARQFCYQGKTAVQVFTKDYVDIYTQDDKDKEIETSWMNRWIKSFFGASQSDEKTEDGWTRILRKKNQVPNRIPVVYFRIEELPSAKVQLAIESLEDTLSDFSEEAKNFAYQSMFIKGKIQTLPSPETRGKIYAASGENDDAKMLSPGNSSDIIKILVEKLEAEVFRDSHSVYLYPEIIKGSDVATASLKLLFSPQIQWCENMQPEVFKGLKDLMYIFKTLVGQIESNVTDFSAMKVSVGMNVWIPQNEKELTEITTMKIYAGIMSRKAGIAEIDNKHPNDLEQIQKEKEQDAGTGINTEANANPYEPNIDNNAINNNNVT